MSIKTRTGLRIRGSRGHKEVKDAFIKFAKWLRVEYEFPIRLPVYINSDTHIINSCGNKCSAAFFAPYDLSIEPYIRIPTGLYEKEKLEYGRNNAIAGFLCSLAHEILHYQQWVAQEEMIERGIVKKASKMVDRYALTCDEP